MAQLSTIGVANGSCKTLTLATSPRVCFLALCAGYVVSAMIPPFHFARHAWADFLSDRRKSDALAHAGAEELLEDVAARDDLFSRLDREFDRELVEEAKARVRLGVELRTWEAFHHTAIDLLSGAETAVRLGMSVGAVFQAKSKVLGMLRAELLKLEGNDGESRL